jgi:hypothetical protein
MTRMGSLVGGTSVLCIGATFLALGDRSDAAIFVAGGLQVLVGVQLILMTRFANRNANPS